MSTDYVVLNVVAACEAQPVAACEAQPMVAADEEGSSCGAVCCAIAAGLNVCFWVLECAVICCRKS